MINVYRQKWVLWFVPGDNEQEGICICPFIFYSCSRNDLYIRLKRHEEFHWHHQLRWLVIPWGIVYWALIPFYGYRDHPWEIMAREAEEG